MLVWGMESYRIALMCSEKDPINCHRTILICRHLRADDMEIKHILEDQLLMEQRLMEVLSVSKQDLFLNPKQLIERAYDMQGEKIAYTESTTD